jgi:hypothetical protein
MKTKSQANTRTITDKQLRSQTRKLITAHLKTAGPKSLELPQFRYLDDVQRHLNVLHARLQDLTGLTQVQQTALASVNKQRLVKATASQLNKKVGPSVKKLEAQYSVVQDLHELYRTVESVEAQMSMQFDGRSGPTYNEVQASILRLKSQAGDQMKHVFSFLEDVAKKHVPSKFKTYATTLGPGLEERAPELKVGRSFMYASTSPQGNLMFTHYAYLDGKTGSSGNHLYASVQWVVGSSRAWVQLNHEYECPAQLYEMGPGREVTSAPEAVNTLLAMLAGEGVDVKKVQAKKVAKPSNLLSKALSYL